MPQLVKGGKFVFGWSKVGSNGSITIPDQPLKEYNLVNAEKVILISGSKTSGGFGVTSPKLLEGSVLSVIFAKCPQLGNFQIPEGQATKVGLHVCCWVKKTKEKFMVPLNTLEKFGVHAENNLLVIRGSGLAVGFIVKGPIIEEAKKHPEIPAYK